MVRLSKKKIRAYSPSGQPAQIAVTPSSPYSNSCWCKPWFIILALLLVLSPLAVVAAVSATTSSISFTGGQFDANNVYTHRRLALISSLTTSNDGRYSQREQWLGVQNKRVYCDHHDYDLHIALAKVTDRPAAWAKIVLLQRYLHDYDWLLWMDGDAIVTNPSRSMEELLRSVDVDPSTTSLWDQEPDPGSVSVHSSLYLDPSVSLCDLWPHTDQAVQTTGTIVLTRGGGPHAQDTLTVRYPVSQVKLVKYIRVLSGLNATESGQQFAAGNAIVEVSATGHLWAPVSVFWPQNGTAEGPVPESVSPLQYVRIRWISKVEHEIAIRSIDLLDETRNSVLPGSSTSPMLSSQPPTVIHCSVAQHHPQVSLVVSRDWNGLNSGVMLWRARGDQWSEELLNKIWAHTSALNHPWWEQKALMDIIEMHKGDDAWLSHIKYVPLRTFNSYYRTVASWSGSRRAEFEWQPGDFAVHAPGLHAVAQFHRYFDEYANSSHNLPPLPATDQLLQQQLRDPLFADVVRPFFTPAPAPLSLSKPQQRLLLNGDPTGLDAGTMESITDNNNNNHNNNNNTNIPLCMPVPCEPVPCV